MRCFLFAGQCMSRRFSGMLSYDPSHKPLGWGHFLPSWLSWRACERPVCLAGPAAHSGLSVLPCSLWCWGRKQERMALWRTRSTRAATLLHNTDLLHSAHYSPTEKMTDRPSHPTATLTQRPASHTLYTFTEPGSVVRSV